MRITELFTAKSIELDSAASNRDEILSRLVELQATHGNITDTEAYKKALYAREDEASTYVDNGITVPHAKTNVVTRPSLAALRLSTPVQYNAEDDGKTDLLFAIAAPENGSLHVDMLARMMQMLMNEDFVEKLKAAKTPAEFLALIDAQEETQFGEESFTQQAIPQSGYRILAVTACPNGIAHTYMAAEALAKAGDKLGLPTKVETNGSDGAKNVLTRAEIAACDGIIVAADKNVETARFDGKPVLFARVDDGIHKPEELLKKVAHCEVPVYHAKGGAAAAEADSSAIPHLSATGIRELDQFSSAFTQLSKDVLDSSTRFLRIMKLASAELGGYELRDDSVYVTDNFFSMLGLAQEQPDPLTPKAFRALMGTLEQRWFYRLSPANNKVFAIPQPDGSTHYITLRITHILGESASEVGLAEDMTTTVLEQQRIEHERDYDTLTGLYRRRAFDRACEALFQQPEKLGCAALLMMDLDNLKQINDTYGHDWGDQYIRQTGQCFAANTPANTICSRLSGDEFLIFFYGYQDQAQLRAQLELLSAALQRSVSILPNGKQLHISISGGIAWYPTDGHDLLTLKKYADFAMYQVKHSHKGRMCDFDIGSYHQEAYAAQTQQDFELLLREELVSYHFQPIYSARSGRVAAYEALMRVDLPTLHSPAQVMQLAHETGRLYEIERITVFHSSEIFQRLQAQGLLQSDALLFINSIANVSLTVEDVEEYAQRYPELLKRLVVEITEQEDLDRACLERKRNVPGFSGSFALDDYGSGYSNELNLLELSPRYIKIDISIVRGIDTDRDKQQIVSNIVAYAHARSMQLIAEGIETEAQLRTVIGLGVDLLQGYYLSHPAAVPAPIAPAAQAVIDQLEHQRFNPLGL